MKKIVALVLSLVMALSLFACGRTVSDLLPSPTGVSPILPKIDVCAS